MSMLDNQKNVIKNALAEPELALLVSKFYKQYFDAFLADGFTRDEAKEFTINVMKVPR